MPTMTITSESLTDIAESIRGKLGVETTYLPSEMAAAIDSITGLTAEDEGKVVVDGSLVEQTSLTVAVNGTYDTTANDEVVVDVSGSGIQFRSMLFLGQKLAANATSLSGTMYGGDGCCAVMFVLHRSALTTPTGWELIDSRSEVQSSQYISVFKKVMTGPTETVTITQGSNVRMAASIWVFESEVNLTFKEKLDTSYTTNSERNCYSVTKLITEPTIAVYEAYSQPVSNKAAFPLAIPNAIVNSSSNSADISGELRHFSCLINGSAQNEIQTTLGEYGSTSLSGSSNAKILLYKIS